MIEVVNFLTSLFEGGLGYGGVASARSALGHVITVPGCPKLADHPLIQRLLKGIGNVRPPKPRYTMIWDTTPLIKYTASLKNEELDFRKACWKTSALLTVLSGQRVSTLHKFKLSNLQVTDTLALFNITEPLKQSKPTHKPQPVLFHHYPHNEQLCPVRLIHVYLEIRKSLPLTTVYDEFFLTHRKPHHPATTDTLARWVKSVLHLSGVNIDTYKPHSYRSASTSHAKSAGVPLEDILRAGQWKSSDCFTTFYDREIERTNFTATQPFAESILNALADSD